MNGKQCSFVWYVDYNKVSHMEAKVVEDLIKSLKNHFGELLLTRRKKHTFFCVNINITEDQKVEIDMKYKLLLAIEVFGESIDEIFNLLASSHIFIVNKQAQLLDEEKRNNSIR